MGMMLILYFKNNEGVKDYFVLGLRKDTQYSNGPFTPNFKEGRWNH